MKTYDPDVEAQIEAGSMTYRDAILFVLDEGPYGFYMGGRGILTDPETGIVYMGAGSLITIEMQGDSTAQTSAAIKVSLASKYEVNGTMYDIFDQGAASEGILERGSDVIDQRDTSPLLTREGETSVLASIESSNWFRRPAIIYRIWLNDDLQVIQFEQRARREIHQILHHEDPQKGYVIEGLLETPSVFRKLIGGKKRNKALQKRLNATDKFMDQVNNSTTQKTYWGRMPPEDT